MRPLVLLAMTFSAAAAPLSAQAPGRVLRATYSSDAGSREYALYVPSGYDGTRAAPLVVMLHGCTQDAADFARGSRMNAAAEAETMLVAYPEQPASANPKKCWNWYDPAHQARDRGEPAIVAGITRRVMAEYRVDAARVYIGGVSAGGAMATSTALAYPELYAALGVHSGLAFGAAANVMDALGLMQRGADAAAAGRLAARAREAMGAAGAQHARALPAIVIHGGRDAVVVPANGQQLADQLAALAPAPAGADASAEELTAGDYRVVRHRRGNAPVEYWLVQELGHAWSGGSPDGTFTDAKGPDATRVMLRFFREHPHPSAATAAAGAR